MCWRIASRPSRSVDRVTVGTGRTVSLENADGEGDDDSGGGVAVGLLPRGLRIRGRGTGTGREWPISESCSDGVREDGGADVGDEDVELSGEDTGEDDGHEGDAGSPMGYDSDSIRLRSSEWCDDKNDIVSLRDAGEGGDLARIGGGDREIARTILGMSRRTVGVGCSCSATMLRGRTGTGVARADLETDLATEMTQLAPTEMY